MRRATERAALAAIDAYAVRAALAWPEGLPVGAVYGWQPRPPDEFADLHPKGFPMSYLDRACRRLAGRGELVVTAGSRHEPRRYRRATADA
jgi:hypothetical protein